MSRLTGEEEGKEGGRMGGRGDKREKEKEGGPVSPGTQEAEAGELQLSGIPGLQHDSEASLGDCVRSCLEIKTRKRTEDVTQR